MTVNPWLGRESVEPYLAAARRYGTGIFCVVKTSNAGGDIQDVTLSDGRPMWHHVAAAGRGVGRRPRRRARPLRGRRRRRRHASARGRRGAQADAAGRAAAAGRRRAGREAGRPRARVHERPGERARQRLALGHLRLRATPASDFRTAAGAEAARLGRRSGRSPAGSASRDGRGGVVRRPVAFLLAATIASSWSSAAPASQRRRGRPPPKPPPTQTPTQARSARRRRASTRCAPATRSPRSAATTGVPRRAAPAAEPEASSRPRSSSASRSACDEAPRVAALPSLRALVARGRRGRRAAAAPRGARLARRRTPPRARCSPRQRAREQLADRVDHEADDGAGRARPPQAHGRRHGRPRAPPRSGRRRIYLRAGEQITVRELVKAALIQSANDAADALALVGRARLRRRSRALMNAKAKALGLHRLALRAPRRARRDRRVLERARRHRARAARRCASRSCATTVRQTDATISGGRALHTWNDLLGVVPGRDRREDRPHERGGLVAGRGRARGRAGRST